MNGMVSAEWCFIALFHVKNECTEFIKFTNKQIHISNIKDIFQRTLKESNSAPPDIFHGELVTRIT